MTSQNKDSPQKAAQSAQQPDCRTCSESRIGEWDYTDDVLTSCFCTKHHVHICLDPRVIFDLPIPDCHSSRPAPAPTNCLAIPCPNCGNWIFRANVDEGYSLFCSSCNWKQKVVADPEQAARAATLELMDELSRAFIGKTDSEIKDIMFFKIREIERQRAGDER